MDDIFRDDIFRAKTAWIACTQHTPASPLIFHSYLDQNILLYESGNAIFFFAPCFLLNPAVFHFSTVMMRQIGDAVGVDNDFFLIFVYVAREFVGIFA